MERKQAAIIIAHPVIDHAKAQKHCELKVKKPKIYSHNSKSRSYLPLYSAR